MIKINGAEIEIGDIGSLAIMDNVTSLDLSGQKIDEAEISVLAAMGNCLTDLDLSNNDISDIGVLATQTNLVNLDLSGNSISDIGALTILSKLRNLNLRGNPLDTKMIAKLKKALPDAVILTD